MRSRAPALILRASARGRRAAGADREVRLSATLSRYLARQVLVGIAIAVFGLAVIAFVVDVVELLRRAYGRPGVGLRLVLQMGVLHLPFLVQKLMPFAVLFGTILTFQRLTRSHELVAARSAGVSIWQFLLPALLVAQGLGVFTLVAFNPLASSLVARYQALDHTYLEQDSNLVSVGQGGLWLRQAREGGGELLIHARQMNPDTGLLDHVVVLTFDADARFIGRIDAAKAHLRAGYWELLKPLLSDPEGKSRIEPADRIPTNLTSHQIQESFAAPETLSFWDLPGFISGLEAVGFSAREHRLYWHELLALPLLLSAMLLIGTTSSLRLVRRGGVGLLITAGLVTGFVFYILSDVVFAIGLSGRLPAVLAAWTPAGVAVLLGFTTLLHLEDG